jgi:uncharacterized membrane protein
MTRNHTGDIVESYLGTIEKLLDRLPFSQRRELLDDLASHIATERAERGATTDAEIREIIERLGSPEVVAAAAYEESPVAPPPVVTPPADAPDRPQSPRVVLAVGIGAVLLVILVLLMAFLRFSDTSGPPNVEQAADIVVTVPTP